MDDGRHTRVKEEGVLLENGVDVNQTVHLAKLMSLGEIRGVNLWLKN